MDQGEETSKQIDWRKDWDGYYQASRTNISEDLGRISGKKETPKILNIYDLYSWLEQSYFRQRTHLEILNDHQKRLDALDKKFDDEITKLTEILTKINDWMREYQPVLDKAKKELERVSKS